MMQRCTHCLKPLLQHSFNMLHDLRPMFFYQFRKKFSTVIPCMIIEKKMLVLIEGVGKKLIDS